MKTVTTPAAPYQKNKQPHQKMGRRSKQTVLQRRHTEMAKEPTERCSTSLLTGEVQIETPLRYHLTPARMAIISQQTVRAGEGVEKWEPYYTVGGNVNWCNHCGKQYGGSSEN